MNRSLALFPALLFASFAVASPAAAEPREVNLQVRYDDLDLSTPEGLKALRLRIDRAAIEACTAVFGPFPGSQMDLGCLADARRSARAQLPKAIAERHPGKSRAVAARDPR